ncbi:MAG: methionyl-tRNA formyltransferase [Arcobacter sp.]|uniref:methionyl-tRNA formyltransferase n=1 Tax=Arcobacter sp. TaxID=1872629 RepID=UPI003B00A7B8
MNIAIIGRTKTLLNTAKLLHEKGFTIKAVITAPAAPEYDVSEIDFENFSKLINAYFISTNKINSLKEQISSLDCDIGISMNYTNTISEGIIECFDLGILNAHLGDLPKYRGNATPNWAIINGESSIPLCIHYMVGGELDSGPVVAKDYKKILMNTKAGEVYKWAEEICPKLYFDALRKLKLDKSYVLYRQSTDLSDIIRCYPRIPEDSKIDWKSSNSDIVRLVNASAKPFSGAYSYYEGKKIIFEDCEICNDNEQYFAIPGQISEINKEEGYIKIITGKSKIKVLKIIYDDVEMKPIEVIKSIRKRFISSLETSIY